MFWVEEVWFSFWTLCSQGPAFEVNGFFCLPVCEAVVWLNPAQEKDHKEWPYPLAHECPIFYVLENDDDFQAGCWAEEPYVASKNGRRKELGCVLVLGRDWYSNQANLGGLKGPWVVSAIFRLSSDSLSVVNQIQCCVKSSNSWSPISKVQTEKLGLHQGSDFLFSPTGQNGLSDALQPGHQHQGSALLGWLMTGEVSLTWFQRGSWEVLL